MEPDGCCPHSNYRSCFLSGAQVSVKRWRSNGLAAGGKWKIVVGKVQEGEKKSLKLSDTKDF